MLFQTIIGCLGRILCVRQPYSIPKDPGVAHDAEERVPLHSFTVTHAQPGHPAWKDIKQVILTARNKESNVESREEPRLGNTNLSSSTSLHLVSDLVQHTSAIASNTRAMAEHVKLMCDQMIGKEEKALHRQAIVAEWRVLASVLERLFFFIYLAIIIAAISILFPNAFQSYSD